MTWVAPATFVPLQNVGADEMNAISANQTELWPYTAAGQIAYSTAADELGVLSAADKDYQGIFSNGTTWAVGYNPMIGASVYNSLDVYFVNDTYVTLPWDSENFDISPSTAFHTTNDSKLISPLPFLAYYFCEFVFSFESNSTGLRQAEIYKNGGLVARDSRDATTGAITSGSVSIMILMSENDYIQAKVWQNSGGYLNMSANRCALSMTFWGSAIA